MFQSIAKFFNSDDFMPHGHCFLWEPEILWLHVLSDAGIVAAYMLIPFALIYFVIKRKDLPFESVFLLFGAFILLCGTTHAMGIWVLWHPNYALEGVIKAMTAVTSIATFFFTVKLIPRALALPSPSQLAAANAQLEKNILEREAAQKALRQAYDMLEDRVKERTAELSGLMLELKKSNAELDEFAYIASHDLKEPLRGLANQATFLLEDYQEKLGDEGAQRLGRLVYLSQRMERLISDLLYFSRLGRTELAIQETDPVEVVHEIEQMMESLLKEHNSRIIIHQPMPRIVCDRPRITEVFRNLITNAVKYNDKPEGRVEVGFLESATSPHGPETNVFYVKDNGIGIAPEFHEQIFHIFKRLHGTKGEKDGTGVGLTFVKKIIERHAGNIWLESEPGKGTTFYFSMGKK